MKRSIFIAVALFLSAPAVSLASDLNWILGDYTVLSGPNLHFPCQISDAQISRKAVKNYDVIDLVATGSCADNRTVTHKSGLSLKGFEGDTCVEDQTHIRCANKNSGFELTATISENGVLNLQVVRFGDYSATESWILRRK